MNTTTLDPLSDGPAPGHSEPRGIPSPLSGDSLARLRVGMTLPITLYYWVCAAIAVGAAALFDASVAAVAAPLTLLGIFATRAAVRAPGSLETRLVLTVAINATWMFGLYVAAGVHSGAYMLEVHMFYFINTAVILAFACWRSVVLTTVAALGHHLILSLLQPQFVWPGGAHGWVHFGNHAVLGALNCIGASLIALSLQRVFSRLETLATEMRRHAVRDVLTGAFNRRGLRAEVEAMQRRRQPPRDMTFLVIDLDGFKQINDTAGHAAGDVLLQRVARTLTDLAPAGAIVARMGGDEFVIALPDCPQKRIEALLDAFFDWTRQPCMIAGREVRFGASVGFAGGPPRAGDIEQLLTDADIALYAAKNGGKNRACRFDAAMRDTVVARKALADDILRGLDADEFEPYFQTQHDAATGRIVGVEALARWNHPTRGLLEPSAFLSAVEAAGRLAELDLRILRSAVDAVKEIERSGGDVGEVSVNLSFWRLRDPGLVDSILDLPELRARLTFEIVETVIFDEISPAELWSIDKLRDRGIGIAIDDFGTGHASILGLTRLRPDKLKIDQQMVRPIMSSPEHVAVLRSIVTMARSLGIATVAEGVETAEEARLLSDMAVDALQGFAFTHPMSADSLAGYLSAEFGNGAVARG